MAKIIPAMDFHDFATQKRLAHEMDILSSLVARTQSPENDDMASVIGGFIDGLKSERDILKAAGYVLKEAIKKLLDSDDQLKATTDEELEEAMEKGYTPEIRMQAETILLARKALGMTSYLFPENYEK